MLAAVAGPATRAPSCQSGAPAAFEWALKVNNPTMIRLWLRSHLCCVAAE